MTQGISVADFAAGDGHAAYQGNAESERVYAELDRLWARGRQVLGCDLAIMGGAMTWVSERNLVAAISNAGGFGVIACGAMPPAALAAEIVATQALTARPFGVNLIVMHPQLIELAEVCIAHQVFGLGGEQAHTAG